MGRKPRKSPSFSCLVMLSSWLLLDESCAHLFRNVKYKEKTRENIYRLSHHGEFPGGLLVGILGFCCHGPGSIPGWETEIPQVMMLGQKTKQNRTSRTYLVIRWIGIHLAMQGHWFDPWSGKIPHATEQLSPCTTTFEPTCYCAIAQCA